MRTRALVGGIALVAALAGCGTAQGTFARYDSVTNRVADALNQLSRAPSVRVKGTVLDGSGTTITLDVVNTAAGEVRGTLTKQGVRADVLVVGDATYLKAPPAWWGGGPRGEGYGNRWTRTGTTAAGIELGTTTQPGTLGTVLRRTFGAVTVPPGTKPERSTVDGVQAEKVTAPNGDVLWISVGTPRRVVRVVGGAVTRSDPSGSRSAEIDVVPGTADAAAEAASAVALGARELAAGVLDAGARMTFSGSLRSTCNASGCLVNASVRNASAGAETVQAVMRARVSSRGVTLGTCSSPATSVRAGATVGVSCRMTSAAWTAFYRRATAPSSNPTTTPYLTNAVVTAVGPAPVPVRCTAGGGGGAPTVPRAPLRAGCPDYSYPVDRLDASFDRSAQAWFGRKPTEADRAAWKTVVEQGGQSKPYVPWSGGSSPTYAHLNRIEGKYLVVEFDRESGALVTAYVPSPAQVSALSRAARAYPAS